MPFKPGQSGNPAGKAPREKSFKMALDTELAQAGGKEKLRAIAKKLIQQAAAGEQWAVKELADRLDGKPAQQIVGAGDGGDHVLTIRHEST